MANWSPSNVLLTAVGRELLSRVQSGNGSIAISRVVSGSGRVSESELINQTAVSNIKQTLGINKVTTNANGSSVEVVLSNAELTATYDLNQLGIYVTHKDYSGEQLYLIAQCDAGKADTIPLPSTSPVSMFYSLYVSSDYATPVTISTTYSGYVTANDLKVLADVVAQKVGVTDDIKNTVATFTQSATRVQITTGEKISSIFGKISKFLADLKAVAFSGSYNDLRDTPSSLPANGGDAHTVDGYTVQSDVPANAKFTDTIYIHPNTHPYSMITGAPTSLPANGGNSATVNGKTVESNVPANAKFTDTVFSVITTWVYAANWSGSAPFTQSVGVGGVTAGNIVFFDMAPGVSQAQYEAGNYAMMKAVGQGTNIVTLKAFGERPTVDIPVQFFIFG